MTKSVEFYYTKEDNNKGDNRIDIFSYVRIGDGGYDYYLISLFLQNNSVDYNISKVNNIFDYVTKHKIKLSKINNDLNDNLYNFLIKILWDYIHKNEYTIFDLSSIKFDKSCLYKNKFKLEGNQENNNLKKTK